MAFTPRSLARRASTSDVPRHGTDTCLSKEQQSLRRSKSVLFQDEDPTFRYLPLDTSSRTIRLTRFKCDEKGKLHGQLRHFKFGRHPTYQALSYTWGIEPATKIIVIDGKQFAVRRNLYNFLQLYAVRQPNQWLWVDQICIDQDAITERNHQVRLMADVFSTAKLVLVWLGSHNHDIWSKFRDCDEVCAASDHTSLWSMKDGSQLFPRVCRWAQALLFNPYWERLWIIQELLLAQRIIVWFDTDVMTWSSVRRLYGQHSSRDAQKLRMQFFIDNIQEEGPWQYIRGTTLGKIHVGDDPKEAPRRANSLFELTGGKRMKLEHVVNSCAGSLCQDPRDKVYGIHSLVMPRQRIPVNYSRSTCEVLVEAAVVILTNAEVRSNRGMSREELRALRECLLGLANAMQVYAWGRKAQRSLHTRNIDRVIGIWNHFASMEARRQRTIQSDFGWSSRPRGLERMLRSGLMLLGSNVMGHTEERLPLQEDNGLDDFDAWLRTHEPPQYKIVKPDLNTHENSYAFKAEEPYYRHTQPEPGFDSDSDSDSPGLALDDGPRTYACASSMYNHWFRPEDDAAASIRGYTPLMPNQESSSENGHGGIRDNIAIARSGYTRLMSGDESCSEDDSGGIRNARARSGSARLMSDHESHWKDDSGVVHDARANSGYSRLMSDHEPSSEDSEDDAKGTRHPRAGSRTPLRRRYRSTSC